MNKCIERLKAFFHYSYLLRLLIKRDVRKKYQNSLIGIGWSLLNPLLEMLILTIIFSTVFKRDIDNFPLYMVTGRIIFAFFSEGTSKAMRSIRESAPLIKKVYIPKYIIVISKVTSSFIFLLITMIDLFIVVLVTKASISWSILILPLYLFMLYLFVIGFGLILSTISTFFRDVEYLYSVFLLLLMYASAIFYPIDIVPGKFLFILKMNPVYSFIEGFRAIVYHATLPSMVNFIYCGSVSVITLLVGLLIFKKMQDRFILHI